MQMLQTTTKHFYLFAEIWKQHGLIKSKERDQSVLTSFLAEHQHGNTH